ncbi:MAG: hypothetical protein HGA45_27120, partial [Chloroflexales bacterium]|nr:hypothetical protein [Chloroflexales bacterium]
MQHVQPHRNPLRTFPLALASLAAFVALIAQMITAQVGAAGTPPALGVSGTAQYTSGGLPVAIAPGLTITDDDNEQIPGALISLGAGFNAATDRLGVAGQGTALSGTLDGLSWSFNSAQGVLTFSTPATSSAYQAALRQVTFYGTGAPAVGQRQINLRLGTTVPSPENGHFYEIVSIADTIDWPSARTAAAGRRYFGLQGYLATITSQAEADFIGTITADTWIGATDQDVDKVWRWATGPEGLEDGGKGRIFFRQEGWQSDAGPQLCGVGTSIGNQPADAFSNWDMAQPNDDPGGCAGNENFALVGATQVWRDATTDPVSSYVVEYGGLPTDPALAITGSATVDVRTSGAVSLGSLPAITAANQQAYTVSGTCTGTADVAVSAGAVSATAPCAGGQFSASLNLSGLPD